MSNLYDDATVHAVMDAIDDATLSDGLGVFETGTVDRVGRAVLDAVAPLIAAKALRDAALDIGRNRRQGKPPLGQVPFSVLVSPVFLERRAAEIERGE
jgi:hypothetical protein